MRKLVQNLRWRKPYWSTLLQSCFVGMVAEAYSAPSSEHSSDYDIVKKDILKAYELVPEAYRHTIRAYKKYESQTYVEFVREKENCLISGSLQRKLRNILIR